MQPDISNSKRIFNNTLWIIGGRIIYAILHLIVSMLTARYFGPSNYGLINYAVSLVAFVTPLMQLGLNGILVRELLDKPEQEGQILGTSIGLNLLSSILCIAGVVSFAAIANAGETETLLVCVLYSVILFVEAVQQLQYWFQAKLLSKYTSIIMLGAYLVKSVYQIMLLVAGKGIYWFALANVIDIAIIDSGMLFLYRRLGGGRFSFSLETARQLLDNSKYYIISGMMIVVFAQTDRIMLKMMIDEAATGYYSAAVTCAGMTGFVFGAIIDSFRPVILSSRREDECAYQLRVTQLYAIIIYASLVQSIVFSLFAPAIISILYGRAYAPAVSALRIIVWYTTFSYLGAARNIWVLAEGKQKLLWKTNLAGAVANVLLNAVLIPIAGINGAAIASLITQVFTNVVINLLIKPLVPTASLMWRSLNPEIILSMLHACKRN